MAETCCAKKMIENQENQPYLHMAKVHYINPQVKSQAVIFVQCKLSVLGQEQL